MSDLVLMEVKARVSVLSATTAAWRNSVWMCIVFSRREINRPKDMP